MHITESPSAIAISTSNCDRFLVVIATHELELDANDVPVPVDCQTIEVFASTADNIPILVTALYPGYKLIDYWQPIEEECPF